MTVEAKNKERIRAFVDAINRQDWRALEQLTAPGFRRHSTAAGQHSVESRDDLISFLKKEYEAFPDGQEVIEDLVAEGNKVAARQRFMGTQTGPLGDYPPSGKIMSSTYLAIYRLEDYVIVEVWAEWDNLSGLVQLGHMGPAAQQGNGADA